VSLAIFDLDHTLLSGDSDYEWGQFLVEHHLVDGETYERENQRYYEAYKDGTLDIYEFLRFALKPLATHRRGDLERWRSHYMASRALPMITQAARELVERHRTAGDTLLIITATNSFVTEPIAREFGIDNLLATEPEVHNGEFTGAVAGTPCFREGKVIRLQEWLQQHNEVLDGAWFYSDSHNDLPLLNLVDRPVAANPDEVLAQIAAQNGWPIIKLH
jgi:HAD superfamily hydrolase (TIGR01490 family)